MPQIGRAEAQRERASRFVSMMISHTINGRDFAMDCVDERIPFGSTEVWTFINDEDMGMMMNSAIE